MPVEVEVNQDFVTRPSLPNHSLQPSPLSTTTWRAGSPEIRGSSQAAAPHEEEEEEEEEESR